MICELRSEVGDRFLRFTDVTPTCGADFCDRCGECISCNAGDLCAVGEANSCRFIRYVDEDPTGPK